MTNKLYKIATAISGEELEDGAIRNGVKNDFYYDNCKTEKEKLEQIEGIAENVINCSIDTKESIKIMKYLDSEFKDSSSHYLALAAL